MSTSTPSPALDRLGAVAALLAALLFRRNLGAEYSLLRMLGVFTAGPLEAPLTAAGWFDLLDAHPFIGLTLLNLFDLVNYALVGVIYLALFAALRRTHPGASLLALAAGLIGVGVYFATNQAFALLALSRSYAAAAAETPPALYLAAGEALLAVDNPGDPYVGFGNLLSLLLVTLAGLLFAAAMLQSPRFGRAAAVTGLLAQGFLLILFPLMAIGAAPALLAIPHSLSAPFLLVWYLLIARALLKAA